MALRTPLGGALLVAAGALGLAGCQPEQAPSYETDVVDESGGELIVEEADPDAVDVTVPETEMTNVPTESAADEAAPAQ